MDDLEAMLARVRLAVFDFDGVFTDNRVWVNDRGEESVCCSRSDGLGLRRLDEVGVAYLIVSTETNPVVRVRAAKLRAACVAGVEDKLAVAPDTRRRARRATRTRGLPGERHQRCRLPRRGRRPGRPLGRMAGGGFPRPLGSDPERRGGLCPRVLRRRLERPA